MNLPQRLTNQDLPWCEDAVFLNSGAQEKSLSIKVVRNLGILARVALIFSRRGFDITKLEFAPSPVEGLANLNLIFPSNAVQFEDVKRDLSKLIDVISISISSDS
ncbi:MAG: ACT domain-containing protein [Oligoflexales bacterium]